MSSSDFFVCDCCGCVDNIRLTQSEHDGWKCQYCRTGTWHGCFERRQYDEYTDNVLNRNNTNYHDLGEASFG